MNIITSSDYHIAWPCLQLWLFGRAPTNKGFPQKYLPSSTSKKYFLTFRTLLAYIMHINGVGNCTWPWLYKAQEQQESETDRFRLLAQAFFGESFCLGLLLTHFKPFHFSFYLFTSLQKCLTHHREVGLNFLDKQIQKETLWFIQGNKTQYSGVPVLHEWLHNPRDFVYLLVFNFTRLNPHLDLVTITLKLLDFFL